MDLSKAFDCILHNLLIAKLHANGFDKDVPVLTYSYLKRRKQCVQINNTYIPFSRGYIWCTPRFCAGTNPFQPLHKRFIYFHKTGNAL